MTTTPHTGAASMNTRATSALTPASATPTPTSSQITGHHADAAREQCSAQEERWTKPQAV
jgi:hypothetical protein